MRFANSASARRLFSYRGIVHGWIAPSRSERSGYGTMSAASYSSVAPNPLQVVHAPRGLLKEKSCGVGVGARVPSYAHSKRSENLRDRGAGVSRDLGRPVELA